MQRGRSPGGAGRPITGQLGHGDTAVDPSALGRQLSTVDEPHNGHTATPSNSAAFWVLTTVSDGSTTASGLDSNTSTRRRNASRAEPETSSESPDSPNTPSSAARKRCAWSCAIAPAIPQHT